MVDALEAHLKITEEILAILERHSVDIARISRDPRPDSAK
jgi:hypothetical protein